MFKSKTGDKKAFLESVLINVSSGFNSYNFKILCIIFKVLKINIRGGGGGHSY